MPLLPSILLRAARQTLALQDVPQGIASNLTIEDRGSTRVGAGQIPQQTGFGAASCRTMAATAKKNRVEALFLLCLLMVKSCFILQGSAVFAFLSLR